MFRPLRLDRGEGRVRCGIQTGLASSPFQLLLPVLAVILLTPDATASTAAFNPYSGIVERNSFGLKPPVNPADLVKPPPPQTADIKLQGITTILGRKQVLMKLRVPAKPPEPVRDQSVVLSEGMREGEVEILEINPADGTVKLNNAGAILSLNMKDNGEKPTPGAAPAPGGGVPPPGMPMIPGVPPPTVAPAPTAAVGGNASMGVTTFGGTESRGVPTIPTRERRSATGPGAAGGATTLPGLGTAQSSPQSSYQPPASGLSVDEQMAVLEVHRAAGNNGDPMNALLPPLPARYQQKK
jgi:hypothetical protein